MSDTITRIRKVRTETGTGGYRKTDETTWSRLNRRGILRLDGVIGVDGKRNTVTYFYTKGASA